jgi:hypothetical protein
LAKANALAGRGMSWRSGKASNTSGAASDLGRGRPRPPVATIPSSNESAASDANNEMEGGWAAPTAKGAEKTMSARMALATVARTSLG